MLSDGVKEMLYSIEMDKQSHPKRAPMCDIELVILDMHVLVANRLVQCATYTVKEIINDILLI